MSNALKFNKRAKPIKIVHLIKDWGAQGIPSYHIDLISLLIEKGYKNFVLVCERHMCPTKRLESLSFQINGKEVFKKLSHIKPDVLIIFHYFGSPFALLIMLVSKLLRIKIVTVTDFTETGLPKIHKSPLKTIRDGIRYILLSIQLCLVDAPVCFTEYEKKVLSKIISPRNKFYIIPIGGNLEIGTSEKENYILTVSRWWSDRKNLHTILRVFSELIKEKNCRLIVVGKFHEGSYYIPDENRRETGEEYKQKIMNLIGDLDLKRYVDFVGVKMGKELQELYRKAKIFYLPSKNETFGLVFVEAMASGTPIVAMKNSAVQYVVKDGVTGFLRNTKEEQKEAILKLLTDGKLYSEMQENCLKEAERYRWENVIIEWEKLIES